MSNQGVNEQHVLTKFSKRDGLEKAVYRIEQAIKRSRTHGSQSDDEQNTLHLQSLLNEAQGLLPRQQQQQQTNLDGGFQSQAIPMQHQLAHQNQAAQSVPGTEQIGDQSSDEHFAVDDAENPLQLLARASDLSVPSHSKTYTPNNPLPGVPPRSTVGRDQDLQDFFGPFRPSIDVGPDIDPIEMGLATEEDTVSLFS